MAKHFFKIAENSRWRSTRLLRIVMVFAFFLYITAFASLGVQTRAIAELETTTSIIADNVAGNIGVWVDLRFGILERLATNANESFIRTPQAFGFVATSVIDNISGFQAINWVNSEGKIEIVVPLESNPNVKGRDLTAHDRGDVRGAVTDSKPGGGLRRSLADLTLYQGGKGFATYTPAFDKDGNLLGHINGVFRIETIEQELFSGVDLKDRYDLTLTEKNASYVFGNVDDSNRSDSKLSKSVTIDVGDRPWVLTITPNSTVVTAILGVSRNTILLGGLILTVVITFGFARFDQEKQAVAKSEAQYRAVVDHQTDLVTRFLTDTTLTFVNEAYCRFFGTTFDEAVGRKFLPRVPEKELRKMEEYFESLGPDNPVTTQEIRVVTPDGVTRWVHWTNHSIFDDEGRVVELQGTGHEVTQRKNAETALSESEKHNRLLIENSPFGIHEIDMEGRFISMNAAGLAMVGAANEFEMIGLRFLDIPNESDRQRIEELLHSAYAGTPSEFEFTVPSGEIFSSSFVPIFDDDGKVLRLMGINNDITERRKHDELIIERERLLDAFFDGSPAGLCILDENLQYVKINEALADINGITMKAHEHKTVRELLPEIADTLEPAIQQVLATGNSILNSELSGTTPKDPTSQRHWTISLFPIEDHSVGSVIVDITPRKRAEESLRKSEELLRESQSLAKIGSFFTPLGKGKNEWSDELYQILGLSRDEFIPKKESIVNFVHPEDLSYYTTTIDHLINHGGTVRKDFRAKHSSGQWRVYRTIISVEMDQDGNKIALKGTVQDVHETKKAEAEKEELDARSSAIIEHAVDGIITVDEKGIIERVNPAALDIFGYTESELLGENVRILLPEHDDANLDSDVDDFLAMGIPELTTAAEEVERRHKNGTLIPIRLSVSEVTFGDQKLFTGILHDLTNEKKLEHQLIQSQRMESIGTLASGIAHDLNNILSPITMSIAVLKSDTTPQQRNLVLDTIDQAAARGADIVKQVLTFARGASQVLGTVSVVDTTTQIGKIIRETFPRNIKFKLEVVEDIWKINGDSSHLHQLLLNLCVNSRDAMAEGGDLLLAAENVILDETYSAMNIDARAGDYVLITISDTGHGISEEILEKIFDPFFTTKEVGEGTGLGLSTAAGIISGMSGFMDVISAPEKGTQFSIYLPADTSDSEAPVMNVPNPIPPKGNQEMILVVDDEESVLNITKVTLENHGYEPITAVDGAEGIAKFAQNQRDIKLIITDIMMPHMDGNSLIRAIKTLSPNLPIIATTGLRDDMRLPPELKVECVLDKPHTANVLLRAVHLAFNPQKKSSDSGKHRMIKA